MRTNALAAGAGALLLLAGAAGAAPTWLPPAQLSPRDGGPAAFGPLVATNAAGDAVVVWERAGNVQAVARRAGTAAWSPPVDVSAGQASGVGLDSSGRAVVALTKGGGFAETVAQAAYRPGPTDAWEAPVTLSPSTRASAGDVAVNAAGDAVVSVTRWSGPGYVTGASFRSAGTGLWAPAVDLSDPAGNAPFGAAVALDEAGNAVAVWTRRGSSAENQVVQASRRPAGGSTWEAPIDVAGPFLNVDAVETAFVAGGIVAVWIAVTGPPPGLTYTLQGAFRPTGGAWGPPVSISAPGGLTDELHLEVDGGGNAIALWRRVQVGSTTSLQTASRSASSGGWGAVVDIVVEEANRSVSFADLAVAPDGNAVALWTSDSETKVRAALHPLASRTWQPPVDIATVEGGAYTARVAADGRGNALALWTRGSAGPTAIEYSELRGAGPVITRLDVPARATALVPTALATEAVPWASPIAGPPVWSFGDSGSATGTSVRHVYARPGDYTVTVAVADAAGGTTTASAPIAVAAPTLANSVRPSIRGAPRVGRTLSCLQGSWTGTAPIRYAYRWLRNRAAIRGAATGRYRVRPRDAGALLACRVTATNAAGSRAAVSRPVRVARR